MSPDGTKDPPCSEVDAVANVVPAPVDDVGGQERMVLLPEEWYWARTRDKASHGLILIPLGYRGHVREKGFLESMSPTFRDRLLE
ncbi:hypothetical protein TNCV_3982161 [Trichonephila clavipes]|nr:hypothetical protein TNCV_3982161 [Trichonephila clavipes]